MREVKLLQVFYDLHILEMASILARLENQDLLLEIRNQLFLILFQMKP